MNKVAVFAVAILVIGITFFLSSCKSDEGLPPYENPNISDTTGKNINLDLFISGELNGIPFTIYNGREGYSNRPYSGEEGFCGGGTNRYLQFHTTSFVRTETLKNTFYIDFKGCLSTDSLVEATKIDSVLMVGRYPYYPGFTETRTVVIRYIDEFEDKWSTTFGYNGGAFSDFELSAVIDNGYDVHSEKIAFGRFDGYLYNSAGDSIRLKSGKFKGRIVNY